MLKIDLKQENLTEEQINWFEQAFKRCARRIILSTTLAGCGHPGGSLSSLSLLLVVYSIAKVNPQEPRSLDRDRIVVSHGHISPGVYSVLCEYQFFPEDPFLMEFRRAGSAFAGHVEQAVPGVEWNTGNLGQGLSAACGMAKALKLKELSNRVFCFMGDGEQQKGQVIEARRWAVKFKLDNLITLIDYNKLQIGGNIFDVMPQDLKAEIEATKWNVLEIDGHNFKEIFKALKTAIERKVPYPEHPTAIIAHTVMGKGISFMENDPKWHGMALPDDLAKKALEELGFDPEELDFLKEKRKTWKVSFKHQPHEPLPIDLKIPGPTVYPPEVKTDCRSAYGKALLNLAKENNPQTGIPKILGLTCDLEGSVKMTDFKKWSPQAFFESGVQEHHTASVAGALSKEGFSVFFSTFGVFAVDEVYNQLRINSINRTALKVVSTHLGADVGEDGPTHQCIDYIGLLLNLYDFEIYLPADPNQTDHIIRYIADKPYNVFVGMGRSKLPIITKEDGTPYFDEKYTFIPGKGDWIRRGDKGVIITYGTMVPYAVKAWEILHSESIEVSLLNIASIRPLPEQDLWEASKLKNLLVVEDHLVETGLGAKIASFLSINKIQANLILLGHKTICSSGKPAELFKHAGLDPESIAQAMKNLIK
ncbi:transketolase [Thermodesulfobacterium sp. TA1]|uniref:transketolase n=1 Tax=Thermodesulfobacterium sp. TA1 TaxID=2234087 RepID=UPI001231A09E|nr:transketolase [Thermodesulfobacterium sp. TA1]QER41428.1 transketolase [Thermodesulfobacterium sp. TA1]